MDATKFVGLSESEAVKLATSAGLMVVVNRVHQELPGLLTTSMQMNRLTLTITGDFVTNAKIG